MFLLSILLRFVETRFEKTNRLGLGRYRSFGGKRCSPSRRSIALYLFSGTTRRRVPLAQKGFAKHQGKEKDEKRIGEYRLQRIAKESVRRNKIVC